MRRVLALTVLGLVALPAAVWADGGGAVPAGTTIGGVTPTTGTLGRLEQESVDEAMTGLALRFDPAPEGKTIGEIHVVNQEVFSRRDWWFQFFNHFHRTTRPYILQRDLLVKSGQVYDAALVEETIRNLQAPPALTVGGRPLPAPELSSVVVILPVASPHPGQVDLLVVTRDIWSLRFNTNFEFQQNTLTLLQTSLSENNLFGWRKYLSVGFDMDQGAMAIGPSYYDPNIAGTRLTLWASARLTYARDTRDYEGNFETFSLAYPLYSLASRWGAEVDVSHQNVVVRHFQGNNLRLEDVTATPTPVEMIPYAYRQRDVAVDASVVRSFGRNVIQRVSLGHFLDAASDAVLPDFPYDAMTARLFLAEFAPVPERRSEPYLRYRLFTPVYAVYRDLNTFDLRENRQLGPSLGLRLGYGLPELGADYRGLALAGSLTWAVGPAGWYGQALLQLSARLREGLWLDQLLKAQLYAATPILARTFRVVVSGEADAVRADTQRRLFFLGGSNGLRGYAIGALQGTTMTIAHAELRTLPVPIFSQRFGGLLFYDVGDAAPAFDAMTPYQDLGLGLRWLIPQLNSSVWRFDWAFAFRDAPLTRAGWPGRFSAGFEQTF